MMFNYNRRPIVAGDLPEHNIPGIRFTDGPRGIVMYNSTCFPVAMARGATWDPELEHQVADAIGVEARVQGANLFAGVCINLLRHPAWGRAQETYGEDPVHLTAMGVAAVEGVQRHVMACVKHFACNSIEDSRFKLDVQIDERTLHELYLPHFKACADAGAASFMSAYNKVNGQWCGHSSDLLTEILKNKWGFAGFVMSDFVFGIRNGVGALAGGQDLEMPFRMHFGRRVLRALKRGRLDHDRVDDAATRLIQTQRRFSTVGEPRRYQPSVVAGQAHRELARNVAADSMVLLQNYEINRTPTLPLDFSRLKSVALLGRLAGAANLGDHGSSRVRPLAVRTFQQGLADRSPDTKLLFYDGRRHRRAARLAARAEAAIVVVGQSHRDEGENLVLWGGDRRELTLSAADERLVKSVAAANPRTIVVLVGGAPIVCESWRDDVAAIVMAWYPGMAGGDALADILAGDRDPGGRLPCVFPRSADDLPFFDRRARSIRYDLYHGYRYQDRNGMQPAWPFGFGLSFADIKLDSIDPEVASDRQSGHLFSFVVRNASERPGTTLAQLFVTYPADGPERPPRELKAFRKLRLDGGETASVTLAIADDDLRYYDPGASRFVRQTGRYAASLVLDGRDLRSHAWTFDVVAGQSNN